MTTRSSVKCNVGLLSTEEGILTANLYNSRPVARETQKGPAQEFSKETPGPGPGAKS